MRRQPPAQQSGTTRSDRPADSTFEISRNLHTLSISVIANDRTSAVIADDRSRVIRICVCYDDATGSIACIRCAMVANNRASGCLGSFPMTVDKHEAAIALIITALTVVAMIANNRRERSRIHGHFPVSAPRIDWNWLRIGLLVI